MFSKDPLRSPVPPRRAPRKEPQLARGPSPQFARILATSLEPNLQAARQGGDVRGRAIHRTRHVRRFATDGNATKRNIDSSAATVKQAGRGGRNPVKAELCGGVEDWTRSTISGLVGNARLPLKIYRPANDMDYLVPAQFEPLLEWLNRPHIKEEALAIQRALRKKEFAIGLNRKTRKPQKLDAP